MVPRPVRRPSVPGGARRMRTGGDPVSRYVTPANPDNRLIGKALAKGLNAPRATLGYPQPGFGAHMAVHGPADSQCGCGLCVRASAASWDGPSRSLLSAYGLDY